MRRSLAVAAVTALAVAAMGGPSGSAEAVPGETHPVNPTTHVALSPCFSDDHGTPVITSVQLSRTTVDVSRSSRSVEVVVVAHDTGGPGPASGLATVVLAIDAPDGFVNRPMTLAPDGAWRTTVVVPKRHQPTNWNVWAVATDRVGNVVPLRSGYDRTAPRVELKITSRPDGHSPVLRRVRLSRTTVDALSDRRLVQVSVQALDGESGVISVQARLHHVGDTQRTHEVSLHRVSGDTHDGRWVGRLVVPLWAQGGRWEPVLLAHDRFGHVRQINQELYGGGAGLPHVWVRSAQDTADPGVASLLIRPSTVDVHTGLRTVVIDVRARDTQSGVAAVRLKVFGTRTMRLQARLVAGTRHDGTWRATLTVGTCDVAGDWEARVVRVTDRRGHRSLGYSTSFPDGVAKNLTVLNVDRVRPSLAKVTSTADSVHVDFTEDVVGISNTSAGVYVESVAGTRNWVAGSWQCADATGAGVDCALGPVRSATFHAEQPFSTPGYGPYPVLNVEHVLDVTDLAGNPAGTARRLR